MSMASKVAVMHEGRIAQFGSPRDVYEAPASRFVADFLGAVNLFAGTVAARDGKRLRIDCAEAGGMLWVEHAAPLPPGSDVAVAVRPEKIALAAMPAGADNALSGTIESIAYRGEASTYRVALATGKVLRVTVPNRARDAGALEPGSPVHLSWNADAALVLEE